MGMWI